MTVQNTAATPAPVTTPTSKPRKQRSPVDRINAKLVQINKFARKWESTFAEATEGSDIVKATSKLVAEKMSALIVQTDLASRALETLKTNNWKMPKARGKSELRKDDVVDLKPRYVADIVKSGAFKKEQLRDLTVISVSGSFATVAGLAKEGEPTVFHGTYRTNWFVRSEAKPKAKQKAAAK